MTIGVLDKDGIARTVQTLDDVSKGSGAMDGGTLRHALATDDPAVIELQGIGNGIGDPTDDATGVAWDNASVSAVLGLKIIARDVAAILEQDTAAYAGTDPVGVVQPGTVVTVTMAPDTSILADGDVYGTTIEIPLVARANGKTVTLDSIVVLDEDDQGATLDLVFFNANTSLGTANSAPSISDANARTIVGCGGPATSPPNPLRILAADYIDLGGSKIQTKTGIGLRMQAGTATTSLWVSAINRTTTPTFTASGLKMMLGFTQD